MSNKILILSCNTGEGHNSAAKALKQIAETDGIQCDIYDTLSLAGNWLSKAVSRIYLKSVQTSLFSTGYAIGEWYSSLESKPKSPIYRFNKIYAKNLYRLICDNGYDSVVCTHPFPTEALTYLKGIHGLTVPTFFVSTDYTCYPFLDETDMDGYMIAHPDLTEEFISKGVSKDRIHVTGIPCSAHGIKTPEFQARKEVNEAYGLSGSSCSGRWFLLMGGSMGFGDMNELVRCLWRGCRPEDRIICVCGNNKKQKRMLDKQYSESPIVTAIGYSDKIPLLLDACDVLFTKPGGLTSTEALNRGIPIIHTTPIKGIEDKNARFFHERGMSFTSLHCGDLAEYAFQLCEDGKCRNKMLESQKHNRLENAAEDILTIIKEALK